MNGNNLVVQRSELIDKASYNLTSYENLLFLSALASLDSRQPISSLDEHSIDLKELSSIANLTHNDVYHNFKKASERLRTRQIIIPQEDDSKVVTGIIQSYRYHDSEAKISVRFAEAILPYVSEIKNSFTTYKFKQVARFKGVYSSRLYQLLIQKIDLSSTRIIDLDLIRELFQLGKTYDKFYELKRKIIEPSLKDINEYSDIRVKYNEIKTGRKVTAIEFHILELEPRKPTKKQIEAQASVGETYNKASQRIQKEKKEQVKKLGLISNVLCKLGL